MANLYRILTKQNNGNNYSVLSNCSHSLEIPLICHSRPCVSRSTPTEPNPLRSEPLGTTRLSHSISVRLRQAARHDTPRITATPTSQKCSKSQVEYEWIQNDSLLIYFIFHLSLPDSTMSWLMSLYSDDQFQTGVRLCSLNLRFLLHVVKSFLLPARASLVMALDLGLLLSNAVFKVIQLGWFPGQAKPTLFVEHFAYSHHWQVTPEHDNRK